jgi:hypothetical protein
MSKKPKTIGIDLGRSRHVHIENCAIRGWDIGVSMNEAQHVTMTDNAIEGRTSAPTLALLSEYIDLLHRLQQTPEVRVIQGPRLHQLQRVLNAEIRTGRPRPSMISAVVKSVRCICEQAAGGVLAAKLIAHGEQILKLWQ